MAEAPDRSNFDHSSSAALAADPTGRRQYAGQVLSSADLSRIYGVTDVDGSQPDCWRYTVEVQDPDLPATELGYR